MKRAMLFCPCADGARSWLMEAIGSRAFVGGNAYSFPGFIRVGKRLSLSRVPRNPKHRLKMIPNTDQENALSKSRPGLGSRLAFFGQRSVDVVRNQNQPD